MNVSRLKASCALVLLLGLGCSACAATPTQTETTGVSNCTGSNAVCKDQALQLTPPYSSGSVDAKLLWPHADTTIETIVNDAAKRAQKKAMAGLVLNDERDSFRTTLDGQHFYLTTNHYDVWPKGVPLKGPSAKDKGYCEFYIYNHDLKFVSSYIAHVGVGSRNTMCNDVAGVSGVAFRGKPALMAIVQYFYTGGPVAHSAAELGSTWIRTTVLLPLVKEPDGKWAFTQDTTCFPPTNTIKTLAKAKAHLATCH